MKNSPLRIALFALALLAGNLFVPSLCFAQLVSAPTEKQLQALEQLLAPGKKKVTGLLEADQTGQYKTYLADIKILAETHDPATRRGLLGQLQRDHYDFIKNAYKSVVINHEEMRKGVAKILGHNNFQLDEFGGISNLSSLPQLTLPQRFDAEFHCPLEAALEENNQALLGFCTADVDPCNINLESASMYDGGCRSKGSLGGKFSLPAGAFQKITVAAQFDIAYEGLAMAFGGYAQANVKIGVRLQGPGYDKIVITRSSWCVAPIIWFTRFEVAEDNFSTQATFSGSFSGGNSFTALAYNETFSLAVPLLQAADAECKSFGFDFIRVGATN